MAPVIDCRLTSPRWTTVIAITTTIAIVISADTRPRAAARFGPVQTRPAAASTIASARKPTLYQALARESPDVQRATTRFALWTSTRTLVAQAASGAVAAKTNEATMSR